MFHINAIISFPLEEHTEKSTNEIRKGTNIASFDDNYFDKLAYYYYAYIGHIKITDYL